MTPAVLAAQAALTVGLPGSFPTVGAALAAAQPGDTVRVLPGVYTEHATVTVPLTLVGAPGAVLDGGGRGTVLTIRAPDVTVRGLTLRGSGMVQSREDAGILAERAHRLAVEGNRFEDVLFGVTIKETHDAVIRNNAITGKVLDHARRGDGIRLWYSHRGRVAGNTVRRVRDVVIWFSDSAVVEDNSVADSRYGLHYMYSNASRFDRNRLTGNHVGAFIMYSTNITFRDNLIADAQGTTGRGLGFKDADHIVAERNILVNNAVGISLDNSPRSVGVTNAFRGNVIAYNDVGVFLLPSVHDNHFVNNALLDNGRPVVVSGGGTATGNRWTRNYWSDYAGFDENGDGIGDTPFVYARLADDLFAKHEPLTLFDQSIASDLLNMVGRVLPFLRPEPVVVDSTPWLRRP